MIKYPNGMQRDIREIIKSSYGIKSINYLAGVLEMIKESNATISKIDRNNLLYLARTLLNYEKQGILYSLCEAEYEKTYKEIKEILEEITR